MSRAFVTNLTYFLDSKGAIAESLPKQSRKLAETLGNIVVCITNKPHTIPVCWSSLRKKRCAGKIDASIELGNFSIVWHCLECGNHGSIHNWVNTMWDGGYR